MSINYMDFNSRISAVWYDAYENVVTAKDKQREGDD